MQTHAVLILVAETDIFNCQVETLNKSKRNYVYPQCNFFNSAIKEKSVNIIFRLKKYKIQNMFNTF